MPARWYVANAPRSARSGADAEESRGRARGPRRPRDARTPQPRADALWESGEGAGGVVTGRKATTTTTVRTRMSSFCSSCHRGRAAQNIRRALPERVRASHSPTRATLARALPRVPLRFARPSAMREAPRIATRSRARASPSSCLLRPPPPAPAWVADLLGMIALSLLGIVLEFADPFERYLVAERLPEYSYPHGPQSVPTWTLPFLGIFIPLGIILLVASSSPPRPTSSSATDDPTDPGSAVRGAPRVRRRRRRSSPEGVRRASAGLCLSVALGFAVTNALKVSVGAFRPDFAARCWPPRRSVPAGRPRPTRVRQHPRTRAASAGGPRVLFAGTPPWTRGAPTPPRTRERTPSLRRERIATALDAATPRLPLRPRASRRSRRRRRRARAIDWLTRRTRASAVGVGGRGDRWRRCEETGRDEGVSLYSAHDAGGENAEGWAKEMAGRGRRRSERRVDAGADDGRRPRAPWGGAAEAARGRRRRGRRRAAALPERRVSTRGAPEVPGDALCAGQSSMASSLVVRPAHPLKIRHRVIERAHTLRDDNHGERRHRHASRRAFPLESQLTRM